jgi:hypothetical protein
MASLQQSDGHIRWKASQDMNGVWMTAYVAPAFAGQAWPIPSSPCTPKPITASAQPGQGEGTQSGKGVIAGGGSSGAPLFSRPKPQSKGKTPGGARLVHNENKHSVNHSKTARGSNAEQPNVTVTAEPSRASESTLGGASGSTGSGSGASSQGSASASSSGVAPGTGLGESGSPAIAALPAKKSTGSGGNGHEVTGTLVGASAGSPEEGALAFGAPGLHSAGADPAGTPWAAIAIAAAALLLGLAGSQIERRRGGAFA